MYQLGLAMDFTNLPDNLWLPYIQLKRKVGNQTINTNAVTFCVGLWHYHDLVNRYYKFIMMLKIS